MTLIDDQLPVRAKYAAVQKNGRTMFFCDLTESEAAEKNRDLEACRNNFRYVPVAQAAQAATRFRVTKQKLANFDHLV